jgi:type I site-specific restriction-modification system R (restriction) subunit
MKRTAANTELIDGLTRNLRDFLPNASLIGFTGRPIEKTDANPLARLRCRKKLGLCAEDVDG